MGEAGQADSTEASWVVVCIEQVEEEPGNCGECRVGQDLLKLVEVIRVSTGGLGARIGGDDPVRAA